MRLVRSGVIEVMNMEYIKTARAKGVAEWMVVVKHAFRNACIPVITVLGLQFGQLLGGAIVTETVFAWPGVATLTVDSIRNQDFPVVQCAVVLLALIIVAINFIVDMIVGLHRPAHPGGRVKAVRAGPTRRSRARAPDRARDPTGRALAAPALAAQVGPGRRRAPAPDRGSSPLARAVARALRPAGGGHPAPPGAARLDGGRQARALARHRSDRARSPLPHDLRRAASRCWSGVTAVLISATIGVLLGLGGGLLRVEDGLDHHDADQRHADVPVRAAGPGGDRGPRAEPLNMIIVLGVAGWPIYARVIRAETLAFREREFVIAGRALGMSHARIIFRQILPNLVSAIVVIATLQIAQVIILESFLSFLGLGVQPPTPAWGNMLGEGRVYMLNSWWIAAFPGSAIFVTTLVINLMGNGLRDWLDPHMKL